MKFMTSRKTAQGKSDHYDNGLRTFMEIFKSVQLRIRSGVSPLVAVHSACEERYRAQIEPGHVAELDAHLQAAFPDTQPVALGTDFAAKFAAANPDASDFFKEKAR